MPAYLPTLNWPIYSGWTQFTPTIPKLYWDVYSQEQRIKQLCMDFHKTQCYLDNVAETTNEWSEEFSDTLNAELEKMWQMVNSGYQAALQEWFENDLPKVIDDAIKMVFFGLTLDGHFVAYIPESWEDIVFDTGMVYELDTYGRLILRWNVNGGVVDQTAEVVRPSSEYSQLYTYIRNIMNTLYNPDF